MQSKTTKIAEFIIRFAKTIMEKEKTNAQSKEEK
jgi:hypothetical protein